MVICEIPHFGSEEGSPKDDVDLTPANNCHERENLEDLDQEAWIPAPAYDPPG